MKYFNGVTEQILDNDDESGDCVEVTDEYAVELQDYIDNKIDIIEVHWANLEIATANETILCFEDGETGLSSDQATWRAYRVNCRSHKKSPVGLLANRPAQPT